MRYIFNGNFVLLYRDSMILHKIELRDEQHLFRFLKTVTHPFWIQITILHINK